MVRKLAFLTRGRFGAVNGAAAAIAAGVLLAPVAGLGGCSSGGSSATSTSSAAAAAAPGASVAVGVGPAAALQAQYEDVIKTALPSVVQINASNSTGSGVVYDDKGDIVTNAHVVGSASTVEVVSASGATLTAKVLGVFAPDDLAVIKVTSDDESLHPARFGQSKDVGTGEIVLAMGSPLGLTGSVTQGIISATGRTVTEAGSSDSAPTTTLADALQTSAAINGGNSGGALVNLSGQVIGIPASAARDPEAGSAPGIGFAIPSDTVTSIADQLISTGKVTKSGRASLGISAQTSVNSSDQEAGVAIESVSDGSPAVSAGLRAGDVITSVDGNEVKSEPDLAALLAGLKPGQQVDVTYTRGGVTQTAQVTLGSLSS